MLGIDISGWNPALDFGKLARKIDFALIKATEADDYVSELLVPQWGAALAAGLEVGYYHFAQPGMGKPVEQAQFCVNTLGEKITTGTPLALDLEAGDGDLTGFVLDFASAVRVMTGRWPLLYSSPAFIAAHLRPVPELARLPLWLAAWGAPAPLAPDPWALISVWQWTSKWKVAGAPNLIDGDDFLMGGRQEFRDLGVEVGTADLAYVKRFLKESAATLEGWANELELGTMDDDRRRQVAAEMDARADEARTLAGDS